MQHESVEVDRPEPGVVLLRASGDVDAYTAPGLRARLHEATEAGGDAELVVVDLERVTFIDAAGLGTLVGALYKDGEAIAA